MAFQNVVQVNVFLVIVTDYCLAFPQVLNFMQYGGGSSGSKDSYNASDIFPQNSNENVKTILDWMETHGVKDLARVPMNSNILDDDDVHDVWTHVLSKKVRKDVLPKKTKILSLKPNVLYKVLVLPVPILIE